MDGRSLRNRRGGLIRTYGRRQLYRRVQRQPWLSPYCQQHLFSSSSSASSVLSSSCEASSDLDFQPGKKKARKRLTATARKVRDPDWALGKRNRASKRKSSPAEFQGRLRSRRQKDSEEEKENEVPAPGGLSFTPPVELGKFITDRRRLASRRGPRLPTAVGGGQNDSSALRPDFSGVIQSPRQVRLGLVKRKNPLEACASCQSPRQQGAVISNLPLLCSTPAQALMGDTVCTSPCKSVTQELEESILHSVCMESMCGSWKTNPPTSRSPPQLRAEQFPSQSLCFPNSKSVIFLSNSTASQGSCSGFCGSAELFSQALNINESEEVVCTDIKGMSPSPDCMQRDSNVLFVNNQKVYLQPVVRLHRCIVGSSRAQDSYISRMYCEFQSCPRLVHSKDENKNAKTNPKVSNDLSGSNHLCRNATGSLSSPSTSLGKKELAKYQADCFQSESNQDSSCTVNVCRKLDMCNAKRSSHRKNALPQMTTMNSVSIPPLLTDSRKAAVSQIVIGGSQGTLPDFIGTGRKVCISGFSSKRWGKRTRTRPVNAAAKTVRYKERNCSFQENQVSLLERGHRLRKHNEKRVILDNISTEYNDTQGPKLGLFSLLDSSSLNSSAIQNFSQDSSCLRYWTQMRATLSLHKKKKMEIRAGGQELADTSIERSYLGASAPLQLSNMKTPLGKQLNKYHHLPRHSLSLLTPAKYSSLCESLLTDAEKVYEECQQDEAVSFSECIPSDKMRSCEKIGEGIFGEVFKTISNGNYVALKIIPIEGKHTVNGEAQKSFGEILPEIIISRELSLLCEGLENSTDGFIKLHSVHCVKGSYPQHLLKAWDTYDKNRGSENDSPAFFESDQLFIILEFEFGGNDLESMRTKLSSVASAKSILQQVVVALAVAEETLHFEHRDLHWGNILVKRTNIKTLKYNLCGSSFDIPTRGVQASIIDYTLSRLEKDGLTVFCDIADDEVLFQGQGDYQFDVYRSMKQENANSWSEYNPHSNVLWIHYLATKLIKEIRYQKKTSTSAMKGIHKKLVQFHAEVLGFVSASEVLQKSSLFR